MDEKIPYIGNWTIGRNNGFGSRNDEYNKHNICDNRNVRLYTDPDREDCNPQPDRVGNDGSGDSTDADRDGPGGDDGPRQTDDDDTGDQNCWGKVTSSLTKNDDGKPRNRRAFK